MRTVERHRHLAQLVPALDRELPREVHARGQPPFQHAPMERASFRASVRPIRLQRQQRDADEERQPGIAACVRTAPAWAARPSAPVSTFFIKLILSVIVLNHRLASIPTSTSASHGPPMLLVARRPGDRLRENSRSAPEDTRLEDGGI